MKYLVVIGFVNQNREFKVGELLDEKDIPKKSKKWLLEQGIIVKKTQAELKKEQEAVMESMNKVRARNEKGHFIPDNPDTEVNEAWVEEE
tara:strand:- start:170 stop:439 length:270 start_codon:yes stop_codon:yes gene_type:complete